MIKRYALLLLLLFFIHIKTQAQVTILDTKKIDRIKNGVTYVLVNRLDFYGAKKYMEVLKKSWTLTKELRFMAVDDFSKNLSPDDSFLSLQATLIRMPVGATYSESLNYYLAFWTCDPAYFKKDRELKLSDEEMIAKIAISVDPKAIVDVPDFRRNANSVKQILGSMDFDGNNLLFNWGPGMVKNYLQQMTRLLLAGKKMSLGDNITNPAELAKLSTETLFVPNTALIKFRIFFPGKSNEDKEENDAGSIFEKYAYNYKVLLQDELDKKIIESDKPFFYLLFIKDSTNKLVCVINSQTGETVYYKGTSISYNLKSGDLKDLSKEISK
ncbi:hypothetical protein BEL04_05050 [Mucilaginibacter sp. PPCGB 2223]|uniref:hypothetical protein n=1 Tax=Mucilaginibacter sp. PPCGB 2223 TaxID=1886027 RepID=UPI000825F295|nr:hypothetical protein [Mucilaginibacter sp. PPCGB 2223]OCX53665.1 hypothetical protein BEL04_05050 [Mucilaginibacter sp. PPCGB 2223]